MYILQYTSYIVHLTLHILQCTSYNVHLTMYILQCTSYNSLASQAPLTYAAYIKQHLCETHLGCVFGQPQ